MFDPTTYDASDEAGESVRENRGNGAVELAAGCRLLPACHVFPPDLAQPDAASLLPERGEID